MKCVCFVIVASKSLPSSVVVITVESVVKSFVVTVVNNKMYSFSSSLIIRVFCMVFQEAFVFAPIACH